MPDREKVIKGLECCLEDEARDLKCWENGDYPDCPYNDNVDGCMGRLNRDALALLMDGCMGRLNRDALALLMLKAQEPRVMTLGDLRDIGSVWELNTPPYLWMDINPSYRWSRGFWVAWRDIYDMIDGLHPTYNADNYGKIWRCWTTEPTEEQREATPWE